MATNPAATQTTALTRTLGRARLWSLIALGGVLTLCVAFSWTTRDALIHLPFLKTHAHTHDLAAQASLVDLHPWQIAQALAPLAVTSEEEESAHEAERLADHEVDQAFAAALRQATTQHTAPGVEAVSLSQKLTQLQQMAKDDQARVHSLTAGGATGEDDLKIAQAQLDLDEDELKDAQQDLARVSGDVRAQIQQELAAHEAAMSKTNAQAAAGTQLAVLATQQYRTLAGSLQAWNSQRTRAQLLQQALQQANADAASLTAQHNALEATANAGIADARAESSRPNAGTLVNLQSRRAQRQLLSIYDDRIDTQQQLAAVYNKWAGQVQWQHRMATHMILRALADVALVLIFVILLEALTTYWLERQSFDRRRMQTLRIILRLGVQLAGVLCVLLIAFGMPSQISTIVGLATAGLTVALQSFILAFFGWFILMGKSGMRVGDWVEINGVAGEVVEVNLFRTTLLETSDWAQKGHPTGRRATFINNFAVTGQFFNFSTVGQWMWDEISVSIAAAPESYAKVALLQSAMLEETQHDARLAEEEWRRLPRRNGFSQMDAGSTVNLRPTGAGMDVLIRYVTRAADRMAVRNRLYERVIEVLHKPSVMITTPPPSKLRAAVLAATEPQEHESRDKRASMYT